MCMANYGFGGPPWGIPIPADVHEQFPSEVKEAFEIFDAWLKKVQASDGPILRSKMPANVATAYETIKAAQIPGEDPGVTCVESCYVRGVEMQFAD